MNRLGRRLWRFTVVYSRDYSSSSSSSGSKSSSNSGGNRGNRGRVVLTGVSLVVVGSASMTLMASNAQDSAVTIESEVSEDNLPERKSNPLVACLSRFLCRFKADSAGRIGEDHKHSSKGKGLICDNNDTNPPPKCKTSCNRSAMTSVVCPPGLVLKKALVIFRHGARTPILTIPNIEQASYTANLFMTGMPFAEFDYNVVDEEDGGPQPYSATEASYTPVILKGGAVSAQLTSLGHYQTYSLGLALRKEYIEKHKLISSELKKDEVYLKSTNINRTIKSLCSVLSGLFGPIEIKKVAPVDIPVASDCNEVLIPKPSMCPNLLHYHMLAQKVSYCQSDMLYDRLKIEKILGIDSLNSRDRIKWLEARDDLVARKVHGLPIPDQLEPFMDVIDKHATTLLYKSLCGLEKDDRQLATVLSCGKAIDLFLQHLSPDSEDSKYKLYLYSCHDSSLCAILGAFDIFDCKWPPFAADLRIELYEDKKAKQYVKVSYLSKDVISRGCDEIYAPYDKFVSGLASMAADKETHDKLCNSSEICRRFSRVSSTSSSSRDSISRRNSQAKAADKMML